MYDFEALELACRVVGVDPDASDLDERDVEDKIYEKFEVSMEGFQKIAEALLKFTPPVQTAITESWVQGYIHDQCFITKQAVGP
ncbi:hypothetical protein [Comamonas sp. MYb69]|uniref:hypothetical protein n=1 Tax=Comamonas sp. MYb69 TaxID=1848650 RepID=UPI0030A7BC1D